MAFERGIGWIAVCLEAGALAEAAAGYGERVSRARIYVWLAVVAVLIVAWMILVNELGYVR